jgi:hypothetical protein
LSSKEGCTVAGIWKQHLRFVLVKYFGVILTLSACAEYMYSAASHTNCSDGVLVLCDFHKVVK